ncbi:hypothetical protein LHK13_03210 [Providencia rettgeri]|nr:hypothetical protein [Providencia rettgeri]
MPSVITKMLESNSLWVIARLLERVYLCSAYFNRPTLGAT